MPILRVLTLALLFLAALPTLGASEAAPVIHQFLLHYAGGDLVTAGSLGSVAFRDELVKNHRRNAAVRCRRLEHSEIEVEVPPTDTDSTRANATAVFSEWSAMPGSATETVTRRFTFDLARVGGRWRIESWTDADVAFAKRLAEASESERRELKEYEQFFSVAVGEQLCQLAVPPLNRGQFAASEQLLGLAEEIAAATGSDRVLSAILGVRSIAISRMASPDLKKSRDVAAEGLRLAERSGNPDAIAYALLRLLSAQRRVDSPASLPAIERTLAMADYVTDVAPLALASTQGAAHHDERAEHRPAMRFSILAERYAQESGSRTAILSSLMNVGGAYARRGDFALSVRYYERALELARRLDYPISVAGILHELVLAAAASGDSPVVLQRAEEAIAALGPANMFDLRMSLHARRATAHQNQKNWHAAERELDFAEGWSSGGSKVAATDLARARGRLRYEQGRYAEAVEILECSGAGTDEEYYGRWWLAQALRAMGRHSEAELHLRAAIAAAQGRRNAIGADRREQMVLSEEFSPAAGELVDLLVECGRVEEALELNDQARATILRQVVNSRSADQLSQWSDRDRQAYRRLDERLAQLNRRAGDSEETQRQIDETRFELDELVARVEGFRPYHVPAFERALEGLPPGVTVVEFTVTWNRAIVFAAARGEDGRIAVHAAFVPVSATDLKQRVERFARRIASRHADVRRDARELYDLLLAPLERQIFAGGRAVCIAPTGFLWQLPFQALAGRDGRYLLERVPLFYASSIALASADERPAKSAPVLLALGNPTVRAASLAVTEERFRDVAGAPLPEAEQEVKAVAAQYGKNSLVFTGAAARESVLKEHAAAADILHIASHAVVDRSAPMYSAVLLSTAPDDPDDGRLEAREILRLRLRPQLVVLSACDTALGGAFTEEGVLGLSWAFLAAGAPTTVISQWQAESKATAAIMIDFHRRLRRGAPPAEALRRAQLAMFGQERYSQPLYWAPFIVLGAGM